MANKRLKSLIQKLLLRRGYVVAMTLRYLDRVRRVDMPEYAGDYIRNGCLELVAHEIAANGVSGNIAELGVYKGEFTKIISELFPERRFYLFDTFEGFPVTDVEEERSRGYAAGDQDFSGTSVKTVLEKVKNPGRCVIRKGYFPISATGIEDRFAFVSIDVDLYRPIYEGLRFFCPRMVRGGYIFIHDYNNDRYKGVKAAVRQYCSENNITCIPLPDACGTVVIGM